eukprot:gene8180-800_t
METSSFEEVVRVLRQDPDRIHDARLEPFREFFTENYGATFPSPSASVAEPSVPESTSIQHDEQQPADLDLTGVIDTSSEPQPPSLTDLNSNPTDQQREDATASIPEIKVALRQDANEALNKANTAISVDGTNHRLFALRAQALLKLGMPTAAIKDCELALQLNPDSVPALRCRGSAFAKLGKWLESYQDLSTADSIDLDDSEEGMTLKAQIKANVTKIKDHKRCAKSTQAKHSASSPSQPTTSNTKGADGGSRGANFGGIPKDLAGNPLFAKLASDPEVLASLQDPEVLSAVQDLVSNPMNFLKYQSNPKIAALLSKVMGQFGSSGGMGGPPQETQHQPFSSASSFGQPNSDKTFHDDLD